MAATVAGCSDNDDAGAVATAPASTTTTAPADQKWKVVPGGDCECADGSEFAFWERRADPTKVVLFLDGGGACYDGGTCAFTGLGNPARRTTTGAPTARIRHRRGIFDFTRADNPFPRLQLVYVLNTSSRFAGL